MYANFVSHLDKEFRCQKSPKMKGPLACRSSVHWNVNLSYSYFVRLFCEFQTSF